MSTGTDNYVLSATQCDHFVILDSSTYTVNYNSSVLDTSKVYLNGISLAIAESEEFPSAIEHTTTKDDTTTTKYILHVHFDDTASEYSIEINGTEIVHGLGDGIDTGFDPCVKMIDHNTSFQLLRVNPKLTGNIKVVVDSDNNMYLDTFKVSKGLSQRNRRKRKINPLEYYGSSIMTHLRGLSSDDIYKIEDSCYSLFSNVNNVGDTYYDVYNSGVRTNSDKLYKENYALLAPLCIKKNMPDFFLVFKCKNIPAFTSNEDRLRYMIENGTVIKSFDMRKGSDVGTYIRNIYNKAKKHPGYIFLSQDYNEHNIFNGISIDRGVMSQQYESSSYERNIKNQVAMNDWYTLGFERNRIVAKDIVNFEFMFDDPNEEMFSLSNYFGLYVRLNGEDKDFSCIAAETSFNYSKYQFDTSIKGGSFVPAEHKNIIYGFSEPDGFHRLLTNIHDITEEDVLSEYLMKPYKNILSTETIELENNTSYLKFTMTNDFSVGEHYRIIDTTDRIIYEVLFSNYESVYDSSDISYDYVDIDNKPYEIRKISIYNSIYRGNKTTILQTQLPIFVDALNRLGNGIICAETNGTSSVSITYKKLANYTKSNLPNIIFQRVLSNLIDYDEVERNTLDKSCIILNTQDIEPVENDINVNDVFKVYGFESLGSRMSYIVSFVPVEYNDYKMCAFNDNIDNAIHNHHSVIYKTADGSYNYTSSNEQNYVYVYGYNDDGTLSWNQKHTTSIPGPGQMDTHARFFPKGTQYPDITDGVLRLFQNYPLNAGVCSVFPVKDLENNIYDTFSQFSFNELDGTISKDGGRFTSILNGKEEYFCDYIDKNERFKSEDTLSLVRDDNTLSKYIKTLIDNNVKRSDISLITPYCCKWESIGTDLSGVNMRVMYPLKDTEYTSLDASVDSYLLASDNDRGIGYISTSNELAFNDTKKHINDGFSTKQHQNFRHKITHENNTLDDILRLSFDGIVSHDTTQKWSRVYKHGNNAIEFISSGVKIRLSTTNDTIVDIAKYHGYSGILICMDGSNPLRTNDLELFVDEKNEQLALIYYNGTLSSDSLYNATVLDETEDKYKIYGISYNKPLTDIEVEHDTKNLQLLIPDSADFSNYADASLGEGLMFLSSPVSDYNSYTKENYNLIIANTGSVGDGIIKGSHNEIYSDSSTVLPSNGNIKNKLDKLTGVSEMFIVTQDANLPMFQTLGNIKKKYNDIAVYIKGTDDTKNYSGKTSVVELNIVEPIDLQRENENFDDVGKSAKIHSTYCTPIYKDVFNFVYDDNEIRELSATFDTDFRGCNTMISSENASVNNIEQLWMRKYVFSDNQNNKDPQNDVTTPTIALFKDFSVLQSCFENNMFRTYTSVDNYVVNNGIDSGYEKNTFFGSRGLQLKNDTPDNTITITNWVGTVVDENKKTVRLNITDSLINYILFSEGFKSNWANFNSTESFNKTKYIKNSILKYINVLSSSVFKLYTVKDSTVFRFFDYSDIYNYTLLPNSNNNIIYENNSYYIELDNLDTHIYSATFTIKV